MFMLPRPTTSTLFPYTTLFRSLEELTEAVQRALSAGYQRIKIKIKPGWDVEPVQRLREKFPRIRLMVDANAAYRQEEDRKSTRLNSSHRCISYAVFCLKKKKND